MKINLTFSESNSKLWVWIFMNLKKTNMLRADQFLKMALKPKAASQAVCVELNSCGSWIQDRVPRTAECSNIARLTAALLWHQHTENNDAERCTGRRGALRSLLTCSHHTYSKWNFASPAAYSVAVEAQARTGWLLHNDLFVVNTACLLRDPPLTPDKGFIAKGWDRGQQTHAMLTDERT